MLAVYRRLARPTVRGVRCALLRDDRVLLVRHTYGDRRWGLPGGLLKRGEDPAAAVRRELREELGLEVAEVRLLGVIELAGPDRARHVVLCFAALANGGEPARDRGEIAEVRWFPAREVPADSLEGTGTIVVMALRA